MTQTVTAPPEVTSHSPWGASAAPNQEQCFTSRGKMDDSSAPITNRAHVCQIFHATVHHQSACDVREITVIAEEERAAEQRRAEWQDEATDDSAQPLRIDDSDLLSLNSAAAGIATLLLYGRPPDISNRKPSGSFRGLLPCMGDESLLCI
jgi:hypothetical protein